MKTCKVRDYRCNHCLDENGWHRHVVKDVWRPEEPVPVCPECGRKMRIFLSMAYCRETGKAPGNWHSQTYSFLHSMDVGRSRIDARKGHGYLRNLPKDKVAVPANYPG